MTMYKNILIASDGSELADKAIEHGIALAKAIGAKVTGVTVTIPFDAYMTSEVAVAIDTTVFEERTAAAAKKNLDAIAQKAQHAGVECTTLRTKVDPIYEGIIDAAEKQRCDLIVMASHGRRGLTGLILGSETTKVLTHSKIPVLVVR
jgi:nucleotide-binding universal stress UspA family protein